MSKYIVDITRKPGVALEPSPFLADGLPSWIAVLTDSQLSYIKAMFRTEQGKRRLVRDVESITINGKPYYAAPVAAE